MQSNSSTQMDEWEEKLELKLDELKKCQESNQISSCNSCDKFFDCELRKKYVLAVYESMSKGAGGGFEF